MTTTERYSKANSLSSQSLSTTDMGHYALPAWKQQLLERKAVNERIWKQAESKKARAALSSFNRESDKISRTQTSSDSFPEVLNGAIIDEQESSASLSGFINVSNVSACDVNKRSSNKAPGSRHVELISPQPYSNKNKLRNAVTLDAPVVEEAVVKVKENPFKMMESEKVTFSKHQRSPRSNENNRPMTPEPIYMNAHIENQVTSTRGRKTARVEPQISSHVVHADTCEADANFGKEFSHVRSMWESRDTKVSKRALGPASSKATDSVAFSKPLGMSRSNYDSHVKESVFPEVPHRVDSINMVASQLAATAPVEVVDPETTSDATPSELPLPNTVSSLKNVYESKDSHSNNRSPFKFRLRDKTPPPAGFRKVHTNSVAPNESIAAPKLTVYQSSSSTSISKDDRPTATVRPVVLSSKVDAEVLKPVTSLKKPAPSVSAPATCDIQPAQVASAAFNAKIQTPSKSPVSNSTKGETRGGSGLFTNSHTVTSIQYKDDVCVENYVPKFVHEYTSDRVTSLLNSLIRDSICFRVIPNTTNSHAMLSHQPAMKPSSATVALATDFDKSRLPFHSSENSGAGLECNANKDEDSTPRVVVIEKPEVESRTSDGIYDASHKLFQQSELPTVGSQDAEDPSLVGREHKATPPPSVVQAEDPTHPKILVFQQSFLGYTNSEEKKEKILSKVEKPETGGELLEVESSTLPVVTSFKKDTVSPSCGESGSGKSKIREAIVVLSTPLPPDLKSCISQKLKASGCGRKISFHEDVYVHEYPVAFWTSEEELRFERELQNDVISAAAAAAETGGVSGAPLAAIEDEMDMFSSPAGSLSDLSHLPPPTPSSSSTSATNTKGSSSLPVYEEVATVNATGGKKRAPSAPPLSTTSADGGDDEGGGGLVSPPHPHMNHDPSPSAPGEGSHSQVLQQQRSSSLEDLVAIDDDDDNFHPLTPSSTSSAANSRRTRSKNSGGKVTLASSDFSEQFEHHMYSSTTEPSRTEQQPRQPITDEQQQPSVSVVVNQSHASTTNSTSSTSVVDTAMLF